jgi:hypothetical protein
VDVERRRRPDGTLLLGQRGRLDEQLADRLLARLRGAVVGVGAVAGLVAAALVGVHARDLGAVRRLLHRAQVVDLLGEVGQLVVELADVGGLVDAGAADGLDLREVHVRTSLAEDSAQLVLLGLEGVLLLGEGGEAHVRSLRCRRCRRCC